MDENQIELAKKNSYDNGLDHLDKMNDLFLFLSSSFNLKFPILTLFSLVKISISFSSLCSARSKSISLMRLLNILLLIFPFLASNKQSIRLIAFYGTLGLTFLSHFFAPIHTKENVFFHLPVFALGFSLFLYYKKNISKLEF